MTLKPRRLTSTLVVALMVAAALFAAVAPAIAGEIQRYDLGKFEIITGTVSDSAEAREKLDEDGDFIAIRFGDDNWFAVVYGNEETPNTIHMRSYQLRYLGGATVINANGEIINDEQPLPVARIAVQSLPALLEFKDEGYDRPFFGVENIGAGNGLFDFVPKLGHRGVSGFEVGKHEPVQKILDLTAAWTLSDYSVSKNQSERTAEVSFSLTATNLSYTEIFDGTPDDAVLEELTLTFHLHVSAIEKSVQVPWYKVRVDRGQNNAVASLRDGNRTKNGTAIVAEMKYDHYLEGWDYQDRNDNSRLMMLTFTAFATFVPKPVVKWMKAQFFDNQLPDGTGVVEYETDYEIDEITGAAATYSDDPGHSSPNANDTSDGRPDPKGRVYYRANADMLNRIQRVKTNEIVFKDNWDRAGRLRWVSNVTSTINGTTTEEPLNYQIHAMQGLQSFLKKEDPQMAEDIKREGIARGIVMLGGYIYPAGDVLFHDPSFEASTILVQIDNALQWLLNALAAAQLVQIAIVALVAVGAVAVTHKRLRR